MRVIVSLRLGALALLFAFPFAPNLATAIGLFLLRNTLNRATNGPRSAITASLVRNQRLGLAGMISSVSRQIPRSVGPVVAGALFDSGMLAAPFVIGAAFQAGYLWLYQRSFNAHDPLRPAGRAAGDPQVRGGTVNTPHARAQACTRSAARAPMAGTAGMTSVCRGRGA